MPPLRKFSGAGERAVPYLWRNLIQPAPATNPGSQSAIPAAVYPRARWLSGYPASRRRHILPSYAIRILLPAYPAASPGYSYPGGPAAGSPDQPDRHLYPRPVRVGARISTISAGIRVSPVALSYGGPYNPYFSRNYGASALIPISAAVPVSYPISVRHRHGPDTIPVLAAPEASTR